MQKLSFLFVLVIFLACQQESTPEKEVSTITEKKTMTLRGEITNPSSAIVSLSNGEDKYEAKVEDGKFELIVKLDEAGNYRFKHGAEYAYLFLEPNDDLMMKLDATQFDQSLTFSGTGAEENNYIIGKLNISDELGLHGEDIYKLEAKEFSEELDVVYKKLGDNFSAIIQENDVINPTFATNAYTDLIYEWATKRLQYPSYHEHYAEKEAKLGDDYYDFLNKIEIDDPKVLENKKYKSFIGMYSNHLAEDNLKKNDTYKSASDEDRAMILLKEKLAVIPTAFKSNEVQQHLNFVSINNHIKYNGADNMKDLVADFNAKSKNEEQKETLNENFNKWSAIAAGQDAPNFNYKNIKGEEVALSDLKGKNVYVDVWATWCGPCLKELPQLEKLQKKYADTDNIVFTSVSIDDDKEKWEKMVTKKEMKGIQIIGDKAWDSSICKDYMIKGIPRFLLIDKDGKIIDANAPRPSSDKIKTILASLADGSFTSMR